MAHPSTQQRIVDAAIAAFGTRGYEATSLDALAADLGLTKQTILYHFASKDALLGAVIDATAGELATELERTLERAGHGWDRVDAVVRKAFRVGARRPALLGVVREVTRLGPPHSSRLADTIDPLATRARQFLRAEMDAGHLRSHDPDTVLFTAYWAVLGMATETEAQRVVGSEPTVRALVKRRNGLLALLRAALVP